MVGRLSVGHYIHYQELVEPGFPAGTFMPSFAEKSGSNSRDIDTIVGREVKRSSRDIHVIISRASGASPPKHNKINTLNSSFQKNIIVNKIKKKLKKYVLIHNNT